MQDKKEELKLVISLPFIYKLLIFFGLLFIFSAGFAGGSIVGFKIGRGVQHQADLQPEQQNGPMNV